MLTGTTYGEEIRIGRVREGEGKRYLLRTSQTMEHIATSTTPIARESWDLHCESDSGQTEDTSCDLRRVYFNPCPPRGGQDIGLEAYHLSSKRGGLKVTKADIPNGVLQFSLSEIGEDALGTKNRISATLRLRIGEGGAIYLVGIGGAGAFRNCHNDDTHDFTLRPPLEDSLQTIRVNLKTGPQLK